MNSPLDPIAEAVEQLRRDVKSMPEDAKDSSSGLELSRRWADALKAGRILFYGTQEVDIGLNNIDWSGSHVAHQEWPAQLNRFFWLGHLARLYRLEGAPELPRLARRTIEDWMDQRDPYGADRPMGAGDNTLNLSIRLGQVDRSGWWDAAVAFKDSPVFDAEFVERMLQSTRGQADYLKTHLTPCGNWRISHLNCLLFCGLVLPGFDDCVDFAARRLREAIHRQVEDDGSHMEHTPSYHGWMAQVARDLWRLHRARPELPLQIDVAKALRMWDYALAACTPDGGSAGLHDSSVWHAGGKQQSELMQQRQALYDEAEAAGWDPHATPSRWFPDAGQLYLRSSWEDDAEFLSFDAARWGGGHCHLSRLAVSYYAGGRMLLYDPGIFSYEMSDPFAPYGKSTPAHNTIQINGWNQAQFNPDRTDVQLTESFAFVSGCYAGGYYPGRYLWNYPEGLGDGVPGRHRRAMLWVKDRFALVLDNLYLPNQDRLPFRAHWQFPAGGHGVDPDSARAWSDSGETNILVQCLRSTDSLRTDVYEGQEAPLRGWLPADVHGGHAPAPQLAFEDRVGEGGVYDLLTLLMPFHGDQPPRPTVSLLDGMVPGTQACRLDWDNGNSDLIWFRPDLKLMADACGSAWTDGALGYVQLENDEPAAAFLYSGFRLRYGDRTLIDASTGGTHQWTRS